MLTNLLEDVNFIIQRLNWLDAIDLILVTLIFFGIMLLLRDTQAVVLLRGVLVLIVLISLLTNLVPLRAFSWLLQATLPAFLLSIPVIFAPEIRRALERLGRAGSLWQTTQASREATDVITSVVRASVRLSDRRHGALVVMQRLDGLQEFVETGVQLRADVTTELILQIFYPNTPLHDGAMIISGNTLMSAASVMPLSASGILVRSPDRQMGLRHRAALGISEISDAVAIVVSEENGAISIAYGGRMIRRLDATRLENVLRAFYRPREPQKGLERVIARLMPSTLRVQGKET